MEKTIISPSSDSGVNISEDEWNNNKDILDNYRNNDSEKESLYSKLNIKFSKEGNQIYITSKNDIKLFTEIYGIDIFIKSIQSDKVLMEKLRKSNSFDSLKKLKDYFPELTIKDINTILNNNPYFDFYTLTEIKEDSPKMVFKDIINLLEENPNINFIEFQTILKYENNSEKALLIYNSILSEIKNKNIDVSYYFNVLSEISYFEKNIIKAKEVLDNFLLIKPKIDFMDLSHIRNSFPKSKIENIIKLYNLKKLNTDIFTSINILKETFNKISLEDILYVIDKNPKLIDSRDLNENIFYKIKNEYISSFSIEDVKDFLIKNPKFDFNELFYTFKNIERELKWKGVLRNITNHKEFLNEYFSIIISEYSSFGKEGIKFNLGNEFNNKLRKYFKNQESFQEFVQLMIVGENNLQSIILSEGINDIYNFHDERGDNHNEIVKNIKNGLKNYSTEELISTLGNHVENYSTTFELILSEVELRAGNGKEVLYFIENNININNKTKIFLKGQYLVGLIARNVNELNKINNLLNSLKNNEKENIWNDIILKIFKYEDESNFFTRSTYSGLLIGINDLSEKNNFIKNKLEEYYENPYSYKELIGMIIIKVNKSKNENEKVEILSKYKGTKLYDKIIKLLNSNKISFETFQKKYNDIISIYGGKSVGGGIERIKGDKEKLIKKGYIENEVSDGISIFEKNGIREVLINYDYFSKNEQQTINIKEILSEKGIKPDLFVFRGHNYYTSKMILSLGKETLGNAGILDGGCRNFSLINEYRKKGIDNQLIAYTSTGKGEQTRNIINYYTKLFIDKKNTKKDFKYEDFEKEYVTSPYVKEYVKFPGNILDIILKI